MAVTSAMVDKVRSRRITRGPRVDGQSQEVIVYSEWIKARLSPPSTNERRQDAFSNVERDVTVIINKKDVTGGDVTMSTFAVGDTIEVDSKVYGGDVYEIIGEIEPIRSKSKLIMYQAALTKRTTR